MRGFFFPSGEGASGPIPRGASRETSRIEEEKKRVVRLGFILSRLVRFPDNDDDGHSRRNHHRTLTEAVHDQILREAEESRDGDQQPRERRLLRGGRVGSEETCYVADGGGGGESIAKNGK